MFFAWKISDMPGILMEVIEHKLGIDPAFKPIRQKKRLYTPERCEAITQEFHRLLEVGFIRPVDYPSWLANQVLVEKLDGSLRMCIDYTNLNKACPKDGVQPKERGSYISKRHTDHPENSN
jgi:hypothetical protein